MNPNKAWDVATDWSYRVAYNERLGNSGQKTLNDWAIQKVENLYQSGAPMNTRIVRKFLRNERISPSGLPDYPISES